MLFFIAVLGWHFAYSLQPVTANINNVTFQKISLVKEDNKIVVEWSINPVQQNAYYEIERAGIQMKFKTVGILFPEEGKSVSGNYIFKDNLKRIGKTKILYYRIKQVNTNGEILYSSISSVNIKNKKKPLLTTSSSKPLHNYSYIAEKQLQKNENNNNVAGNLRNTLVDVEKKYILITI